MKRAGKVTKRKPSRQRATKINRDIDLLGKRTKVTPIADLPSTYEAAGLKRNLHGTVYQLKLQMLFLHRARKKNFDFRLATEIDIGEKFDDVLFQRINDSNDGYNFCFLQAKHKQDEEKNRITFTHLNNKSDGDFSLEKYIKSFVKLRKTFTGKHEYVIYTNIDFDQKSLDSNNIKLIECNHNADYVDFLKFFATKKTPKQYTLGIKQKNILFKSLKKVTESVEIVKDFLDNLVFVINQPNEVELGEIIEKEIGVDINMCDSELVASCIQKRVLDWFKSIKNQESDYYNKKDVDKLYNEVFVKVNSLISVGFSILFKEELDCHEIYFSEENHRLKSMLSACNILTIVSTQPRLNSIRLSNEINKMLGYTQLDTTIFCNAEKLLNKDIYTKVKQAFSSSSSNFVLAIECITAVDNQLIEIISDISSITNENKKIIITLKLILHEGGCSKFVSENNAACPTICQECLLEDQFIKLCEEKFPNSNKILVEEPIKFSDLEISSKQKLMNIPILFQSEKKIALNQILSVDSQLLDELEISDLISDQKFEVGKRIYVPREYNPDYYIERTLEIQGKDLKKYTSENISLAYNIEASETLEENSHNACWIGTNSDVLLSKKSSGDTMGVSKQTEEEKCCVFDQSNFSELMVQAKRQKVFLIADTAGMGKSTLLTHLSLRIKDSFPHYWVIRVDLNEHVDIFEKWPNEVSENLLVEKLSNEIFELQTHFDKCLFESCLKGKEGIKTKLIVLFDGFDEISPNYEQLVTNIMMFLKQSAIEQLWITTRPHIEGSLKKKLGISSSILRPFTREEQITFLLKFWLSKKYLNIGNTSKKHLRFFAISLIERLSSSIRENLFAGVPLQTRLLAEAFEKDLEEFCNPSRTEMFVEDILPDKINLLQLYQKFITCKYIYFFQKGYIAHRELAEVLLENISINKNHQMLALSLLLPHDQILNLKEDEKLSLEQLSRIGMIEENNKKIQFVHRTFAEFFAADFFARQLKKNYQKPNCQTLMLLKIFKDESLTVVRSFLDAFLCRNPPSSLVLKQYGEHMSNLWRDNDECFLVQVPCDFLALSKNVSYGNELWPDNASFVGFVDPDGPLSTSSDILHKQVLDLKHSWEGNYTDLRYMPNCTLLHKAEDENNIFISKFILSSLRENREISLLKYFLLTKNQSGLNAWYSASIRGKVNRLKFLLEHLQSVPYTLNEIRDLFLVTGNDNRTMWHWATLNMQTWKYLWSLMQTLQLDTKMVLYAKDKYGRSVFHWVAEYGTMECFREVFGIGEQVSVNPKEDIYFSRDSFGQTPWHCCAFNENDVTCFDYILDAVVQKNLCTREEMFFDVENSACTGFHCAINAGNIEAIRYLWHIAQRENFNLIKILEMKSKNELPALLLAAKSKHLNVFEETWNTISKSGLTKEVLKNLLIKTNVYSRNILHYLIENGNRDAVNFAINLCENFGDDLKLRLLLQKNYFGHNPLFTAVSLDKIDMLLHLWDIYMRNGIDLRKEVLLFVDKFERSIFYLAVRHSSALLRQLIFWADEMQLEPYEIRLILIRRIPSLRVTILHAAILGQDPENLSLLWGLAKSNSLDLRFHFTQIKDDIGQTLAHYAVRGVCADILEMVWKCSAEVGLDMKNEVLLPRDFQGETPIQWAARNQSSIMLKTFWKLAVDIDVFVSELLPTQPLDGLIFKHYESFPHYACHQYKSSTILDRILSSAHSVLSKDKFKNIFLSDSRNAWLSVVSIGDSDLIQVFLKWADKELAPNELIEFLLKRDEHDRAFFNLPNYRLNGFEIHFRESVNSQVNRQMRLAMIRHLRGVL